MLESVQTLRPRMMSVAYRMLGSVVDAEDAVQDAFLRLQSARDVTSPEGFLIRTTTRRCIDQLRAQRRRRTYVGPWVPEPVDTSAGVQDAMLESLSQGFLLMLERLSPTERAAFILRSVFDYEYAEIAEVLGKNEVSARKLVSRAKEHLAEGAPRFRPAAQEADDLAQQFLVACRAGDVKQIEHFLTEDVEVMSDGGGKVTAARAVIRGRSRVARFMAGVFHKRWHDYELRPAMVNGGPGFVISAGDSVIRVMSLRIEDGVKGVYLTLNPDKLSRWSIAKIE